MSFHIFFFFTEKPKTRPRCDSKLMLDIFEASTINTLNACSRCGPTSSFVDSPNRLVSASIFIWREKKRHIDSGNIEVSLESRSQQQNRSEQWQMTFILIDFCLMSHLFHARHSIDFEFIFENLSTVVHQAFELWREGPSLLWWCVCVSLVITTI